MKPLLAHNPGAMTGRGNNTYLVGDVLIDAGVGEPRHVEEIAAALGGRPLAHVVVTHGHADHSAGVPALQSRWPGLQVSRWQAPLRDGDLVQTPEGPLRVVHTPGHAADHICLVDDGAGEAYTGDMVVAGTTVLVPSKAKGGSMREYLASLQRIRDLDLVRLWPGHGPALERPRDRIGEIIEHRLMREAQVAACLAEGITDPAIIVKRIYDVLPAPLVPFAEQTVIAHIEKLNEALKDPAKSLQSPIASVRCDVHSPNGSADVDHSG